MTQQFLRLRDFLGSILSPVINSLQGVSALLSLLFFGGILYILIKSKWLTQRLDLYAEVFFGEPVDISRRKSVRGWNNVLRLVRSDDPLKWREALAEAGKILDELLKISGYQGRSVHERLDAVRPEVLSNIADLRVAHLLHDELEGDSARAITRREIIVALRAYRVAFRDLELLDDER